jgi:hypothetical protein
MGILIFIVVVVIVLALVIWALQLMPIPAPANWILQVLAILIAAVVILQRAGVG